MKTRKFRRIRRAIALAATLVLLLSFVPAALAEPAYCAWIGETGYETLEAAVNAAQSGDTITLGEGVYTLYNKGAVTKDKDLTFVGAGTDKTTWLIGPKVPDPEKFGTEYNSDYSFDGRGSEMKETVTFRNMTLQSGSVDYLGFAGSDNTVVENCVIEGKTFYWGYSSAVFHNTTFIAPNGDYAVWTYSSPVMTFEGCTFHASGKVINVYTDFGAGKNDITVNFIDCTVDSTAAAKSALNINDQNMGEYQYYVNISGVNSVSGLNPDDVTCSRLFGFGGTQKPNNNSGRSVVSIDGTVVWEDGAMVSHAVETENDIYTDGYADDAFTITVIKDWAKQEDGSWTRTIEKVCDYCGNTERVVETKYPVHYDLNGGEGTADADEVRLPGEEVTLHTAPMREGYRFTGWNTSKDGKGTNYAAGDAFVMPDGAVTLFAQWEVIVPQTGDAAHLVPWIGVLTMALAGAAVLWKTKKARQN